MNTLHPERKPARPPVPMPATRDMFHLYLPALPALPPPPKPPQPPPPPAATPESKLAAYGAGFTAALQGKRDSHNPYPTTDENHWFWLHGMVQWHLQQHI